MTKRDVMSIALKIIGIACIVYSLISLPGYIYGTIEMSKIKEYNPSTYTYSVLRYLMLAICAYVLIVLSPRIARWVIPDDSAIQGTENVWSGQEILMLVARMMGIYFLLSGLLLLSETAVMLMQARTMDLPYYSSFWINGRADLVRAGLQIIASIYLLSGAKAMITAIYNKWPAEDELDEEETSVG